jgi:hypothetical protein
MKAQAANLAGAAAGRLFQHGPYCARSCPRELHAVGGVLGIKRICVFDREVCVEQFVRVFVRIGNGRRCAAKVNRVPVARHDGVDRRILPRPQTFEAKLVFVIGDRAGNIRGEELRCDLTDHGASVPQSPGTAARARGRIPARHENGILKREDLPKRWSANRKLSRNRHVGQPRRLRNITIRILMARSLP